MTVKHHDHCSRNPGKSGVILPELKMKIFLFNTIISSVYSNRSNIYVQFKMMDYICQCRNICKLFLMDYYIWRREDVASDITV